MAYTQYSPEQINSYFQQNKVSGDDPWAWYNHAKQNNADPLAVAAARGVGADQAQAWLSANIPGLTNQIQGQAQLAQTNPQQAYAAAQARGYSTGVAEQVFGAGSGAAAPWAQSQGLTGFGSQAGGGNPYLQIGGTPTQAANSPASPYAGAGASTAGSTPATMPATGPGNGTNVPDYMVSPGSNQPGGQQRNPYMQPAGGPSYGNDPRSGGPGQWGQTGQQGGMAGLGRYLSENPHMLAMGNEITRNVNDNLQRNIMPGIRGNAMASGTVGGSRQGVAEGLATGESMKGLAGALANLYGGQFNQDRGYGLQSDALDFGIHRGNLQDMRQGQQDQVGFLGQMANWNQQGIGAATQVRDQPFADWQRFVQPASQMAGLGGQTSQQLQGNPWLGAMGGYMAGSKYFGG
jgi:hypothetical protein